MVPVMRAQAGIHDFGRIDPQAVDGRNKPGHDGKRTPMGHSQGPLVSDQIKGLGFNNIRKLSFVTCHGASEKRRNKGVCQWFIQSVCTHLAPELTSMVADSEYFSVMVPEPDMAAYEDPNAPHDLASQGGISIRYKTNLRRL
jgi:hypothetical protein